MPTIPHIHFKIVHSRERLRVAPRSCARRFLVNTSGLCWGDHASPGRASSSGVIFAPHVLLYNTGKMNTVKKLFAGNQFTDSVW
jgi:hypothetical protein